MLVSARPPEDEDPELRGSVPPAALLEPVLAGVRLRVAAGSSRRARRGARARSRRRRARPRARRSPMRPTIPACATVRAYADLLAGDDRAAHAALVGLCDDPEVGVVARFLKGAAMFQGGNPKEALRDFDAALAASPRLLAGVAPPRRRVRGARALRRGRAGERRRARASNPKEPVARPLARGAPRPDRPGRGRADARHAGRRPSGLRRRVARARDRAPPQHEAGRPPGAVAAYERFVGAPAEGPRRVVGPRRGPRAARVGRGRPRVAPPGGGGVREGRRRSRTTIGLLWFDRGAVLLQSALDPALGLAPFRVPPPPRRGARIVSKALARGLPRAAAARART